MGLCSGKRFEIEDKLARGAFFEHAADVPGSYVRTAHRCVQRIGATMAKGCSDQRNGRAIMRDFLSVNVRGQNRPQSP
jgi:hypothetical protein